MHLLVILLQQILGLLAREQPVPQPEPVVRRAVDPRSGEGRGEGRLGSEGRSPDAFARWNEPDRSSLPLTPKHRVASIGSRSCSPPGSTLRNHDWGYQTAKTMAAPLGSLPLALEMVPQFALVGARWLLCRLGSIWQAHLSLRSAVESRLCS